MAVSRSKAKSRREAGPFAPFPMSVLQHENYRRLSGPAAKLLTALMSQVKMKGGGPCNNGDLCATHSMMKEYGLASKSTLSNAIKELLHYGFIVLTRQGEKLRKDKPSLYAITWWAIDECGGKLDVSPTTTSPGTWRNNVPKYQRPKPKKHHKQSRHRDIP